MRLEADFSARAGSFTLDISCRIEADRLVVFGRSGAGKSTFANVLAGLIRPARGLLRLDGDTLFDLGQGRLLPPEARQIGYVFQDGRLFPHLTVRQNLDYGRRWLYPRPRPAAEAELIELLRLATLLDRYPAQLSGGERQRVALGRALARQPRRLIMDEPLSSLDVPHRRSLLDYIERLVSHAGIPLIYVTHSREELARLADQVLLLEAGRVVTVGPPAAVLEQLDLLPGDDFEAGGILEAEVESHDPEYALTRVRCAAGFVKVPLVALAPGTPVRIRLRARDLSLALQPPIGASIRNVLPATITGYHPLLPGPLCLVAVELGGNPLTVRITRQAWDALGLAVGRPIQVLIKSAAIEG